MITAPRAGNDVIDVGRDTSTPSRRFVERVCVPSELLVLGEAPDRRLVWALFAAKEAAFKAHAKSSRRAAFSPRTFVVSPELDVVRHAAEQFRLRLVFTEHWIHALAYTGSTEPTCDVDRISQGETESAAARRVLRELAARTLGRPDVELEVVREDDPTTWSGRGPPFLSSAGCRLPCDVSLSHDGRFAACALLEWT